MSAITRVWEGPVWLDEEWLCPGPQSRANQRGSQRLTKHSVLPLPSCKTIWQTRAARFELGLALRSQTKSSVVEDEPDTLTTEEINVWFMSSHTEIKMTSFIVICRNTHIYLRYRKIISRSHQKWATFFKVPVKITYNKNVTTQIFFPILILIARSILK